MKMLMVILVVLMLGLVGCGEAEVAGGFIAGAASMAKMGEDSQIRFIEAVNALDAETARLNAEIDAVSEIDPAAFVKPETVAAIESLRSRKNDPMTWAALAGVLGAAFFGGKVHGRKP